MSVADGWSNSSALGPEKHSLAMILRDHGPIPPHVAVDIALDVCDALAAAHADGVVHGDLGLHRVRTVWPRRPNDGVDIFALAADDTAAYAFRATRAGTLVSPEQRAARPIDTRADVWAVGMLLHWMLTGQAPATDGAVRLQMLPRALAQMIEACIATSPEHRPSTVDEISASLGSFASCPTERFERLAVRRGIKTGSRAVVRGPDVDSVLGRLEAAADERERFASAHMPVALASTPLPAPVQLLPAAPPVPAPPQPKARTAWTAFRPIIRKRVPTSPDAREVRDPSRSAFPAAHLSSDDFAVPTVRVASRYPDAPANDAPCSVEPVTPLRVVDDRITLEPPTARFEARMVASVDPPTTVFNAAADASDEPTIAPSSAHFEVAEPGAPATTRDEVSLYGAGGESPTVAAPSVRAVEPPAPPPYRESVHVPSVHVQQLTERMAQQPASIAPVVMAISAYPSPLPPHYFGYMAPLPATPPPPAYFGPPPALGAQLVARAERSPWKTFATVCCAAAALAFGLSLWSRLGANESVHVAAPPPPAVTAAAAPSPVAAPTPIPTTPAVTTVSLSALPTVGTAPTTPAPVAVPTKATAAAPTSAPSAKPRAARTAPKPKATAASSATAAPAPAAATDDVPSSREE